VAAPPPFARINKHSLMYQLDDFAVTSINATRNLTVHLSQSSLGHLDTQCCMHRSSYSNNLSGNKQIIVTFGESGSFGPPLFKIGVAFLAAI
jgi:hypothetical protein